MSTACDPKGHCPQCGYENGAGVQRCVRCRSALMVPQGCSGACSKCLAQPVQKKNG
ncbi:MAG TPA: hypothetical protein VGK74_14110 [Symbiobacteriaceae bacterium]|jgi:hypothetical protein